jgi:hypothetical protein
MKKKQHRYRPTHRAARPRNAGPGFVSAAPRSRAPSARRSSHAPEWKTIAAAVAGGAGSAALGGLIVNQQILSSEAVGIGLMLGGGATAYFADGIPRVVGTSVAAAGAGQFALAVMNKRAVKAHGDAQAKSSANAAAAPTAPAAPALPAPPAVASDPPRRSASGGGMVVDLFRDAANDLDVLEDEWRYGIRDDASVIDAPSHEPVVIDLDEAA